MRERSRPSAQRACLLAGFSFFPQRGYLVGDFERSQGCLSASEGISPAIVGLWRAQNLSREKWTI